MNQRSGCLTRLARLLAFALAGIFVLSLPMAMLAQSGAAVLFNPARARTVIQTNLVDSTVLRQLVFEGLISEMAGGPATGSDLSHMLSYVGANQREAVAQILLPQDYVRGQVANLVDSFYAWLDTDAPLPDLRVDLGPIQANLENGGSEALVDLVVESWPVCTPDQLKEVQTAVLQGQTPPVLACQLPEPLLSAQKTALVTEVNLAVHAMPASVSFTQGAGSAETEQFASLKRGLDTIRSLARWLWLIPVALLGLIMAVAVRSWQSWLRWWGYPLLLGGLLTLLLSLVALGLSPSWLINRLAGPGQLQGFPVILRQTTRGMISDIYTRVADGLAVRALIVMVVGAAMAVVGYFTRPAEPRLVPEPAEPTWQRPAKDEPQPGEGEVPPSGMFG